MKKEELLTEKEVYLDLERVFLRGMNLKVGTKVGDEYIHRDALGGTMTADAIEGGFAYTGLVGVLSPLFIKAIQTNNKKLIDKIEKILSDHKQLQNLESKSEEYIDLCRSAYHECKTLFKS